MADRVTDGFHPPLEEYLSAIFELGTDGMEVISARLCEHLNRSAPTVKEMVDRLIEDGYLTREGRILSLTVRGSQIAERVVRRHRLAERLLHDVIGLEWHKIHAEAGRWEHVISDDVEEKLVAMLGDPATCPHGNPIPGSHGIIEQAKFALLAAPWGETFTVIRIAEAIEHDDAQISLLADAGLLPGAQVQSKGLLDGVLMAKGPKGVVEIPERCAQGVFLA